MKRIIKFRFWNKNEKQFEYDNLESRATYQNPFEREDLITCQFTGLWDKNGKEIYEGDILGYPNPKARYVVKFGTTIIGIEEYDQTIIGFYKESLYGEKMFLEQEDCFEVIGNIYENPELLEDRRNY